MCVFMHVCKIFWEYRITETKELFEVEIKAETKSM